jgi:hypothetical protein
MKAGNLFSPLDAKFGALYGLLIPSMLPGSVHHASLNALEVTVTLILPLYLGLLWGIKLQRQ